MDAIAQLKTTIYALLTQDAEMIALWGGTPRVANVWPDPDEPMPYIVYRVTSVPVASYDVMAAATMTIDIWDEDATGERASVIRQRVVQLLEGAQFNTANGHFRIRKSFDAEMEEEERYVWHNTSDWTVRYTRTREIARLEN